MGTEITLTLNEVDIDWGKNRFWRNHSWLFPPGSITDIEYVYAGQHREVRPGFRTTVGNTHFRLRHLGYSMHETWSKFDLALSRWNRTSELHLSFQEFSAALSSIDFVALSRPESRPPPWDFCAHVRSALSAWDTPETGLEDFLIELDFAIMLRVLTEPPQNRGFPLQWHHFDLVENGWASIEDLNEVDRPKSMMNHTIFFGRLYEHSGVRSLKAFEHWLANQGCPTTATYVRIRPDGTQLTETTTLPSAVRNKIHHPENPLNNLPDHEIFESLELLLSVAARLRTPLPNLA